MSDGRRKLPRKVFNLVTPSGAPFGVLSSLSRPFYGFSASFQRHARGVVLVMALSLPGIPKDRLVSTQWRCSVDLSPPAPPHRSGNAPFRTRAGRPVAVPYVPRRAVSASRPLHSHTTISWQDQSTTPLISPCVTGFPKAPVPPRRQRHRCIRKWDGRSVTLLGEVGISVVASHWRC